MFSSFLKTLPQISIFHNPSSPASVRALAMLRSALSAPYPPDKQGAPPLQFNLEIVERAPPTPDQIKTIVSYLQPKGSENPQYSAFPSAHPSAPELSEQPQTAAATANLVARNPEALKWPLVVDWHGGRASVGDVDGVKTILEALRQRRDGEVKDDDGRPAGWFS
ncbi:thioredoxin-like protein [Pisolithus thermaeus]|nr:thioredoxin-like protein [Pisolithus thermaeus]